MPRRGRESLQNIHGRVRLGSGALALFRERFVKSRSLYEVQRQTERRGHGFARSARGSPRALLAPELVPGWSAASGGGIGGRFIRPDPHTARTTPPPFLGYTLIAQKKDDVLSDKYSNRC